LEGTINLDLPFLDFGLDPLSLGAAVWGTSVDGGGMVRFELKKISENK
jgi:hypothetical protein